LVSIFAISFSKEGVFLKVKSHKSDLTITSPRSNANFLMFFRIRSSLAGESRLIAIITAPTFTSFFKALDTSGRMILAKEDTLISFSFKASSIKGVFLMVLLQLAVLFSC
jgi:hypothetical protein